MRVLIQANTDPTDEDGHNLNLAFRENEILPWSDDGNLKNCKKDDIVFIIIKVDGKNKVMYKCIIVEDNVDISTTIDDSKYYYSKMKQEENASNRTGTCLLLKKLQYIDDDRLYMKKLKEEGLTKRDFEQNHTTDKFEKRKEEDSKRKIECFNRLDQVFNEYSDIENDFKNIESESDGLEEKYRKDFVKIRVDQGKFRDSLIKRHDCKCDICGLDIEELLIASHIKEYASCKNSEHIDLKNGLLLCANHDKLFDKHLISFYSNGRIKISKSIAQNNYGKLNIDENMEINKELFNEKYMSYHRCKLI